MILHVCRTVCKVCQLHLRSQLQGSSPENNVLNLRQYSSLACFPKTWIVLVEGVKPGGLIINMYIVYLMEYLVKDHVAEEYVSDCPGRVIPRVCQNPKSLLRDDKMKDLAVVPCSWPILPAVKGHLQLASHTAGDRLKEHWAGFVALEFMHFLKYLPFVSLLRIENKNNHCMCLAQIHFLLREQSQRRCHRSWQN